MQQSLEVVRPVPTALALRVFWCFAIQIAGVDAAAVLNCSSRLRIHQLTLGTMQNYQYILDNGRDAVSVDAAWDVPRMRKYLNRQGLKLIGGLYTHGHFDHIGGQMPGMQMGRIQGASELRNLHGEGVGPPPLPIWIGTDDIEAASLQTGLGASTWTAVHEGDMLSILGEQVHITVINTPGHTQGGVSYWVQSTKLDDTTQCEGGVLFTGDTVFINNVGRTDLPGGSQQVLLKTLSRISTMPETTLILPGHSYDAPPRRANLQHVKEVNEMMRMGIRQFPTHKLPPIPRAELTTELRQDL